MARRCPLNFWVLFRSKIILLPPRLGERYASALSTMTFNNYVNRSYGKIDLKKYIESFCDYIEISVDEFWEHVRNSVNSKLFEVKKNGDIVPKFEVGVGLR